MVIESIFDYINITKIRIAIAEATGDEKLVRKLQDEIKGTSSITTKHEMDRYLDTLRTRTISV